MKKIFFFTLFISLLLAGLFQTNAFAFNYFEMETYPYQTEGKGKWELENATLLSQGTQKKFGTSNVRTSFEAAYGLFDRVELAAYVDFARLSLESFQYGATRLRGRTYFAEKGEWPVDVGAYFETEINRGDEGVEMEFRGIVEKDFGRWTLDLNPILEQPVTSEETKEPEFNYAAALIYRLSERLQPKLEFFGDLGDAPQHVISPAVALRLGKGFRFQGGLGFGLNNAAEQRLARLRAEWEF